MVASFIDGREIGKGEITQEAAEDETENNALIAIFWPIIVLLSIIFSPFVLIYYIGEGVRKIGENTAKFGSYKNNANSNRNNLSRDCTHN